MSQPTPPPTSDVPSPARAPEKPRRKALVIGATVTTIAAVIGIGAIVTHRPGDDGLRATTARSSAPAEAPASPEAQESTPEAVYAEPTVDDFLVTLHTTKRQCSGNAGCTVIVEPDFAYIGADDTDPVASYDVTYEIRGDRSGPITATAELYPESMSFSPTMVETASSDTRVTVRMTGIVRGAY
ncbi:hypothetical protein SAM23877_6711 [Streptomyces ambofaciens ATCC 23877]|uniref:Uncharacterized protein n=1 Tax=Streptomyces ambofaciens (strain ATCC 23877 / 3486 / DSM 40053 / JCM 4204 / NBRC 12836 / NRRL B-2516) TaxID=278992 RepID=A0ADL9_STRA7|nr:hypothetical protein [Streptomyces ambofaciens]AKZ59756.1 hypothetical protein SAM23877_6711 [Streptomyces ambofaciens ATCC 23877]CAJ88575.1 conserved hypothetical protein [Streptomyces ambofaciens ATCC 23877]